MFASLDEVYGRDFSHQPQLLHQPPLSMMPPGPSGPSGPPGPPGPSGPAGPHGAGPQSQGPRIRANLGGAGMMDIVQSPFASQYDMDPKWPGSGPAGSGPSGAGPSGSGSSGSGSSDPGQDLEPSSACHYIWHHVRHCAVCQHQWVARASAQAAQAASTQAPVPAPAPTAPTPTNWFWIIVVIVAAFIIGMEVMRWIYSLWPHVGAMGHAGHAGHAGHVPYGMSMPQMPMPQPQMPQPQMPQMPHFLSGH